MKICTHTDASCCILTSLVTDKLSLVLRKRSSGFLTRSDTNRAVQPQKIARGLKFQIKEVKGLYYPCSKNKGADQLSSYCAADLRPCFRICKKLVFSQQGSYNDVSCCRYYQFDDAVIREILGKKLSSRNRKDLDDVNEKTKVSLRSCRRQVGRDLSCVARKPVFGVSNRVQHKPGCTATEDG